MELWDEGFDRFGGLNGFDDDLAKLIFIGGIVNEQYDNPRSIAVVACMRKCNTLHQGVYCEIQGRDGVPGIIEIKEQAA